MRLTSVESFVEAERRIAEYALAAGGECAMSEPHRTASSGAVPRPGWRSASRLGA